MDRAAEQAIKTRFLSQNPAAYTLRAGHRALIGANREGMMRALP